MSGTKKRMSNRDFLVIVVPIIAVLLVAIIVATALAGAFGGILDMRFGRGDRQIVEATDTKGWDTDYVGEKYGPVTSANKAKALAKAKEAGMEVNLKLNNEGMILLKNNGVLPLVKGSGVTPFGRGYKFPNTDSPNGGGSMKHTYGTAVQPDEALSEAGFTIVNTANALQPASTSSSKAPGLENDQNASSDYNNYPDQPANATGTTSHSSTQFGASNRIPELGVNLWKAFTGEGLTYMNVGTTTGPGATGSVEVREATAAQKSEMAATTALVFVSRTGSENLDKKMDGYNDETPHYLALTANEKAMIKAAKTLCKKVVLCVNSTNPVELGPVMTGELEADAILWVGNPGESGFTALGTILNGEVNPSGRMYDILPTNFLKDSSTKNWGNFGYSNAFYNTPDIAQKNNSTTRRLYVEYEEGMYMGYRYYETAHDIGETGFTYGKLNNDGSPDGALGAVAYPFGYGLSYTTFTQTMTQPTLNGLNITFDVTVKNTGSKAGKEVVEVYYNPPYTQLDKDLKLEKPTATLAAFAKTKLLAAGATEVVKISFPAEQMASYSYMHDNGDGTKGCYMLEEGAYKISIRKDSHRIIEEKTWTKAAPTTWYIKNNPRQLEKDMQAQLDDEGKVTNVPAKGSNAGWIAATNLFPYMNDYMNRDATLLTRSNWDATVPKDTRTNANQVITKVASKETLAEFVADKNFHYWYDPPTNDTTNGAGGNGTSATSTRTVMYEPEKMQQGINPGKATYVPDDQMPKGGEDNGLSLAQLRGVDYYDELWDQLLNQIDWKVDRKIIEEILTTSNYYTKEYDRLGSPRTAHCEGANGIRVGTSNDNSPAGNNSTTTYTACPTIAATFNVELIKELGQAMAQEALYAGLTSRMSPAFNLHRSPFSGRNLEYFSEDPYLCGRVVTAMIEGTDGIIEHLKHIGLNDQETNRSNHLNTWADEQTVRELYNRPFEMAIRDARRTIKYTADVTGRTATRVMRGANAIMVGQNCFGPSRAFINYELIHGMIREEWGFTGTLITDWYGIDGNWGEGIILAGCDTFMRGNSTGAGLTLPNYDTASMRTAIRTSLHNVLFNIANSNALHGAAPGATWLYDMSPWQIWLIVINVVVYLLIAGGAVWIVLRFLNEKKHPEKYRNAKRDLD